MAATGTARRRGWVLAAWVVVGAVMVGLAAVTVDRVFLEGPPEPGDATSVADVARLAEEVTEAVDLERGVELLCDVPLDLVRMAVESTVQRWAGETEGSLPPIRAAVSDVSDGATGSFVIAIRGDDPDLTDADHDFRVFVEQRDGRSCVTGVGGVRATRPTTEFSGEGYDSPSAPPARRR